MGKGRSKLSRPECHPGTPRDPLVSARSSDLSEPTSMHGSTTHDQPTPAIRSGETRRAAAAVIAVGLAIPGSSTSVAARLGSAQPKPSKVSKPVAA